MKKRLDQIPHFESLLRRNRITWLWAAAGALALNLALFSGMPHLLRPLKIQPVFDQVVSQVNVIRLKRPETPAKRKTKVKPPATPPQRRPQLKPSFEQPLETKLSLPFDVNPRLAAGPVTISIPPMPPAHFDISGLDRTFNVGDLDSPFMVLSRIPPLYPMYAKRRGIEGWVRVRFIITKEGQVENIEVIESEPRGVFEQNVLKGVAGWRFKPPTVEGVPVKAAAETTIRFKLD